MLVPIEGDGDDLLPSDSRFKVVVSKDEGVRADDESHVFLIDHCCTWRSPAELRYYINAMDGLKQRLTDILNITMDDDNEDTVADEIVRMSWQRCGTYPYRLSEVDFDVWFLNDELGARIRHHNSPTFKMASFFYEPLGGAFSILWPLENCNYGHEVTRDYHPAISDQIKRNVLMRAFGGASQEEIGSISEMKSLDWFNEWVKIMSEETEPDGSPNEFVGKDIVTIFTDIESLSQIQSAKFKIVESRNEADIIWCADHNKDFKSLAPNQLISQFPNEFLLTTKVSNKNIYQNLELLVVHCDDELVKGQINQ